MLYYNSQEVFNKVYFYDLWSITHQQVFVV